MFPTTLRTSLKIVSQWPENVKGRVTSAESISANANGFPLGMAHDSVNRLANIFVTERFVERR